MEPFRRKRKFPTDDDETKPLLVFFFCFGHKTGPKAAGPGLRFVAKRVVFTWNKKPLAMKKTAGICASWIPEIGFFCSRRAE